MRKLIFFILLLAILGGAGYGVYYLVTDKNNDSVENTISIEVSTSLSSTVPTYDGIEVSYEGEVKLGETIIVKAEITDERCAFSHWELNGVFYSDTLETTILLDKYGLKNFVAVVSVGVDVDVNNTIPEGLLANALTTEIIGNKKLGEQITLVATISSDALEKYDFDGWYIDSERISPLETYTLTLDTVEDKNFEARLKYTFVQLSFVAPQIPESDYTVNTTTDIIKSIQGTRKIGQTVTLSAKVSTAAYNNGYEFDYFTINGVKVNSTLNNGNYIYLLELKNQTERNIKIFLKFIPEDAEISLEKNHVDGVTVSKEGWAVAGRTITLKAVVTSGYEFNYWTDSNENIISRDMEYQINSITAGTYNYKAWATAPGQLKTLTAVSLIGQSNDEVDFIKWIEPSNKGSQDITYEISFKNEDYPELPYSIVGGLTPTSGASQNEKLLNIITRIYSNIYSGTYKIIAKTEEMTDSVPVYIYVDAKYYVGKRVYEGGRGSENEPYLIGSAAKFVNINNYNSKKLYFKLTNSFEYSGYVNHFTGYLDGNNKIITLSGSDRDMGLFNRITFNSNSRIYVKNLKVNLAANITFRFNGIGGILASDAYGTDFINCSVYISNFSALNYTKVSYLYTGNLSLGGLVGKGGDCNFDTCKNNIIFFIDKGNEASVINLGGIVGSAYGSESYNTFNKCENEGIFIIYGNSSSTVYVDSIGGIAGYSSKMNFMYCTNLNNSQTTLFKSINTYYSNIENVGGVVGYADESTFVSCLNKADYNIVPVIGNNNVTLGNIGGIIGYLGTKSSALNNTTISNCENQGIINTTKIESKVCIGGMVGFSYDNIYFSSCINKVNLTAYNTLSRIGSLIGECRTSSLGIESCTNSGNISGGYTSDTSGNKWYGKKGA